MDANNLSNFNIASAGNVDTGVLANALGNRQQQLQKQANQETEFGFQQQQLSNANKIR